MTLMPFDWTSTAVLAVLLLVLLCLGGAIVSPKSVDFGNGPVSRRSLLVKFGAMAAVLGAGYVLYSQNASEPDSPSDRVEIDLAQLAGLARLLREEAAGWPPDLKVIVLQNWEGKTTRCAQNSRLKPDFRPASDQEINAVLYLHWSETKQRTARRDWTVNGPGKTSRSYDYWTADWKLVDLRSKAVVKAGTFDHEGEYVVPDLKPHLPELFD